MTSTAVAKVTIDRRGRVTDVEPTLASWRDRDARVLVCVEDAPAAFVEISAGSFDTVEAGFDRLARSVAPDPPAPAIPFSVVVCTRNRPELLRRCVESILATVPGDTEVIVVDNAPSDSATEDAVRTLARTDDRLLYRIEATKGLSRARNLGAHVASNEFVAFTDDDVRVDTNWLHGLARGFGRSDRVGIVTGLVPAAEFETDAQRTFDQKMSWSTRLQPELFDIREPERHGALFPFSPGWFGTGANFAVRREAFEALGGFDVLLGPGTHTKGGEDLDLFTRAVLAGWQLAYEPSSIVWHVHRREFDDLRTQMFGYGIGLTAFYARLLARPGIRRELLRRVPRGASMYARARRNESGTGVPRALLVAEYAGLCYGPAALLREAARRALVRS
jgi:GT2 family glycosyltransferase